MGYGWTSGGVLRDSGNSNGVSRNDLDHLYLLILEIHP